METIDRELGYVRIARKPWRCVCAEPTRSNGSPNPEYREGCEGLIPVGARYFEYIGEAMAYSSGVRYCESCAVAVWTT